MRYIMRQKLSALGNDFTVQDDQGKDRFVVDSKSFGLGRKLTVRDMSGNELATIHQKVMSVRPTYEITHAGSELAEVRRKLLTFAHQQFTVEISGADDFEVKGDMTAHKYTFTRDGHEVAHVSKEWVTLRDTYGVEIDPGQDDVLILASTVVIDMAN